MNPASAIRRHHVSRLVADGVAFRYPHSPYGLPPVSLTIGPGEFVHIAGNSGSGKSTLARCLTGLIPHLYRGDMQGEVFLDGLKTGQSELWRLAERAGMVFQNPAAQMLGASVEEEIVFGLENLGHPPEVIGQRLETALTGFGLQALRKRPPLMLSGGEQQKLALAAIMARRPSLLVLDEPLSMLDVTAAIELVDHLVTLSREGTAIVIFEHRGEYLQDVPGIRRVTLNGHDRPVAIPRPDRQATLHFPFPGSLPELVVEDMTVRLGQKTILHDLGFTARGGQTVAIVGRNGSGKTTLLRALAGLQSYDGVIRLRDGDRPDLGLVFQNADLQLFNPSVGEEILYRVADPDMDLYHGLLGALGLVPYERTPPLLLSEGEKKRVALATVLMRRPHHGVLLDEPSLGQDSAHKEMLLRTARALNRSGLLVIITTHDLTLAAQADRILLLGRDGFVADGPPAQVLADKEAWAQIGLQVPAWLSHSFAGGEW